MKTELSKALPTVCELTWRTTSAFHRLAQSYSNGVPGLRRSPSRGMLSRSFPACSAYPRQCRKVGLARRRGTHFSASPSRPFCVTCAWWTPRWNPPSSCRPAGSPASCRSLVAERHTGSHYPSGPACRSRLKRETRDDSDMAIFFRIQSRGRTHSWTADWWSCCWGNRKVDAGRRAVPTSAWSSWWCRVAERYVRRSWTRRPSSAGGAVSGARIRPRWYLWHRRM